MGDLRHIEYQRFFELAAELLAVIDFDGVLVRVNGAWERALGWPPASLVGKNFRELIHPADIDATIEAAARTRSDGVLRTFENRYRRADGSYRTLRWTAVVDAEHNVIYCGARDVTAELSYEAALRASEQRYRALFASLALPAIVFDLETFDMLDANEAALAFYGYSRAEILSMNIASIRADGADPGFADRVRAHGIATPFRIPSKHVRRDRSVVDVEIIAHAISYDGRPARLSLVRDLTHTKLLEQRLAQAQKMEAVGRLAGGVAHDFNNMLAVILNVADFAAQSIGPSHPAAADLGEIVEAANRAAALTRQLLAFSRQQMLQPKLLKPCAVVANVEKLLRRVIGEDVSIDLRLAKDAPQVLADEGQLEQVIMNLGVNARDAMPSGGTLTIETSRVLVDAELASRVDGLYPGVHALLTVTDTGVGMDSSTLAHVFEPFFTTKDPGRGTGLGLATVFGIVRRSGGAVEVTSVPGDGTTFRIYLPAAMATRASSLPVRDHTGPTRGSETVLVVEDDPSVRAVVRRVLGAQGYLVIEAGDAYAALSELARRKIDVVITDVVMPGSDGVWLAERVRHESPHVPMILMSGYSGHPAFQRAAEAGASAFLQKPFSAQELAGVVRGVLDGEMTPASA
jgi:PAS domain S-box-containing protein